MFRRLQHIALCGLVVALPFTARPGLAWMIQTDLGHPGCALQSGPITTPSGEPAVFVELRFQRSSEKSTSVQLDLYYTDYQFASGASYNVTIVDSGNPNKVLFEGDFTNSTPYLSTAIDVVEKGNVKDSLVKNFAKAILGPKGGHLFIDSSGGAPRHGPFVIDTTATRGLMAELSECIKDL